jgi:hypothetical protein
MLLSAFALLLPLIADSAAGVHKCKDAQGTISYTDQPCHKDATALEVPHEALRDAPVTWLCEAQSDRNDPKLTLSDMSDVQRSAYVASGYGEGFLRLANARHFMMRGNFYLCDESKGKSTSQLVEMVITPEGHMWMRRDGRVTHQSPAGFEQVQEIKEIRPAAESANPEQ